VQQAMAITLVAGGSEHRGAYYKVFREEALAAPFTVTNSGDAPLRAVVAVSGSPKVPEPASESGLVLTREYFTQSGQKVDPASVRQNTRLVVVLSAGPPGENKSGRFLLVDRLPAGFEIENPNLVGSGDAGQLPWLSGLSSVDHSEFRDDRFAAAFTDSFAKVAYLVRAVAPGRYAHPGASVEDMYRPDINARLESGAMSVVEK
jgi:uncharacterized protein YfaS (alpha-2-macroglobulin family)